jgi:hypothetical protein
MTRTRFLLTCGAAALALAAAPAPPAAAASSEDVTLSGARLDMLADGRAAVSFSASGAVRGLLTLRISHADGEVRGTWALVSRHLEEVTPEGEIDPRAEEIRAALPGPELHLLHKEYIRFVNSGGLHGTIDGGALDFDVDGRLRSVGALKLTIAGGSGDFASRRGTLSLDAANLHNGTAGTGTLRPAAAPTADGVTR